VEVAGVMGVRYLYILDKSELDKQLTSKPGEIVLFSTPYIKDVIEGAANYLAGLTFRLYGATELQIAFSPSTKSWHSRMVENGTPKEWS